MALLSKKEFASKCGMTTGNLSNYITRKKVYLSGDYIDDAFAANAEFLAQRQVEQEKKVLEGAAPAEKVAPVPAVSAPAAPAGKKVTGTVSKEAQEKYKLDMERERLEIEKLSEANRYAKIKADKAEGLVVPTELVKQMFLAHGKSITNNAKMAIEAIVDRVATICNMSNADRADIRKKMIDELNKVVTNSIADTKKGLKNIVSEHSETRGVGERE